jgi:hypothetical protein
MSGKQQSQVPKQTNVSACVTTEGTQYVSWLRRCATSLKVAGSILDEA